jgi:acetoacetate decarboxylase
MAFVTSQEERAKLYRETYDFYNAEVLTVFYETKQEIIERLLPPPLKPATYPIAFVFVANYPKTNFGVSYLESALFLRATFEGEEGNYCLSMPVTSDMALIGGREMFGYPKKIGQIDIKRQGQEVHGWTERHDFRFLDVRANLTGTFNVPEVQDFFAQVPDTNFVMYNFKYFPAPDGQGFDYNPRLMREEVAIRPNSIEAGEARVSLQSSQADPWGEVEVVRVLGATYSIGNNSMQMGRIVAEVDPNEFIPYAHNKVDVY